MLARALARHLGLELGGGGGCSIGAPQLPRLAAWCSRWRAGEPASAPELEAASAGCPGEAFQLLPAPGSAVPDACAMALGGAEAVTSLQAAVARYRPRLMAASAA